MHPFRRSVAAVFLAAIMMALLVAVAEPPGLVGADTTTTTDTSTTTTADPSTSSTTTSTAPGGPTSTSGDPATTASTTTETSTTTSTTTTVPASTTTTTEAPPEHWALAPTFDVPVDDSLAATQVLLNQVITAQATMQAQHDQLTAQFDRDDAELTADRAALAAAQVRRKNRAISLYVTHGVDVNATLTVDNTRLWGLSVGKSLDQRDAASERTLHARIETLTASTSQERDDLDAMAAPLTRYQEARTTLENKISGSATPLGPVPIGPTDIAQAADRVETTSQTFAGMFLARDLAGVATASADRDAALHALATLVAGPTPGAYPADLVATSATSTTTSTTSTTSTTTTSTTLPPGVAAPPPSIADQLYAAWSVLDLRHLGVLMFALEQVGKPYVWADAGPSSYDCSGLTMRAWDTAGVRLDHFSGSQTHSGPPVPPDQLLPGDLLTYGPDGNHHVTLYLGAGRVVEAKGTAWGVIVSNAHLGDLARAVRVG